MSHPLNPTDQYVDASHYDDLYTVYERADGTAYKITVSRYTGEKTVTEYTNRQAFYAWKHDKAFDPEGKNHKGVVSDGGSLREQLAVREMQRAIAEYKAR